MVEVTQSARELFKVLFHYDDPIGAEYVDEGIFDSNPRMAKIAQAFAAAEHRAHIAGMREAAGIADMHDHRGDTAQAIRQRATAIETGADHGDR